MRLCYLHYKNRFLSVALLSLGALIFIHCGVEKQSERIASSSESVSKSTEELSKTAKEMKELFKAYGIFFKQAVQTLNEFKHFAELMVKEQLEAYFNKISQMISELSQTNKNHPVVNPDQLKLKKNPFPIPNSSHSNPFQDDDFFKKKAKKK